MNGNDVARNGCGVVWCINLRSNWRVQ